MIPRRLIRTVPAATSQRAEIWWNRARELHPDWQVITLRDPVNRKDFPLTNHLWDTCESGAQKADLIRTEELWWRGGVYIDSDVDCFKPFDPLLGVQGFCAWEDTDHICNAVIGFEPAHPALEEVLKQAMQHHDEGTWHAGVGVFTNVMRHRHDVLVLPPQTFYQVHWRKRDMCQSEPTQPWEFCRHHWAHSWR